MIARLKADGRDDFFSVNQAIRQAQDRFDLGTFAPGNQIMHLARYPLPDSGFATYLIEFTARNGSWRQIIEFQLIGTKWMHAKKLQRDGSGEILYELVPNDFPIHEQSWLKRTE